ncbi:MAG: hypothetical protein HY011_05890 [Acidobacteria bacterium]|nr:hypothetical protein [Acidobacteriota bacterium]
MNPRNQIKELTAAYWLGCLTVLIQTYLAARYVPYNALPDEAKDSLAARLLRDDGQAAALIAAGVALLALSLAKRGIKWKASWKLRWLLPWIAANGWALVFLKTVETYVNSQSLTLTPLLTAIHPTLDINFVCAVVLQGHAISTLLFLGLQYICLVLVKAFYQPVAEPLEQAEILKTGRTSEPLDQ